jgi:hypothetical protein
LSKCLLDAKARQLAAERDRAKQGSAKSGKHLLALSFPVSTLTGAISIRT